MFMCMSFVCMSVHHMHAWCPHRSEEGIRSLELKLQMFMSHHGNRIWSSAKTSAFHHLSQLSSSPFFIENNFFFEHRTLYYSALACLELAISVWPWIHSDLPSQVLGLKIKSVSHYVWMNIWCIHPVSFLDSL